MIAALFLEKTPEGYLLDSTLLPTLASAPDWLLAGAAVWIAYSIHRSVKKSLTDPPG